MARLHFSGVAGAGMNPLAQLMAAWGHQVQGSDRGFDQGKVPELRARLRSAGITLLPQDGSGIVAGLDRLVVSAAVEDSNPDVRAAQAAGLTIQPRPALLAEVVNAGGPGVAIAGTSGKSTITGMVAWILRRSGRAATILGGAALAGEGVAGGVAIGPQGGPVVAEACESDGTLIGYHPAVGLVHNISRDHGELNGLLIQFRTFAAQARTLMVNTACAHARALANGHPQVRTYGLEGPADLALECLAVGPDSARGILVVAGVEHLLEIPHPGRHNLENAVAACAVVEALAVPLAEAVAALRDFPGVARRFQVLGVTDDHIRVVDDFAHNGEKIRAALLAAQAGADRVVAVFQPHGYGPARFLRLELAELLPTVLRPQDRFCYAEIYFAGGTVTRDLSSQDLANDLPARLRCGYAANHQDVLRWCADQAIPGDTVLIMGARDPDLPRLAQAVYEVL